MVAGGANRNDMKLAGLTLKEHPQNMCMDKGFNFPEMDELVGEWGCATHIARKGIPVTR